MRAETSPEAGTPIKRVITSEEMDRLMSAHKVKPIVVGSVNPIVTGEAETKSTLEATSLVEPRSLIGVFGRVKRFFGINS